MDEIKKYTAESLVSDLEDYYARKYNDSQRLQIVSRLSSIQPKRLSGLYSHIVEACDRPPLLSRILEIEAKQESGFGYTVSVPTNGEYPWETRAKNARKAAKDYADSITAREPECQLANQEGYGSWIYQFLRDWAEVQHLAINQATNLGSDQKMLGWPRTEDERASRYRQMFQSVENAKQQGRIHVPIPSWIIAHAKHEYDQVKKAPPLKSGAKSSLQVTREAAQSLKQNAYRTPKNQEETLPPIEAYAQNLAAEQDCEVTC